MTEIWFIRHGETDWNRQRRLQGWKDIPLNEFGVNQASLLAARLRDEAHHTPIHAIYSSDLQRAHATAVPVSEQLGLRVRVEPGIRERGFGVLEGLDHEHIDVQAPEAAAAWKSRDPLRPLGQFQSRVISTVDDIASRHDGERILMFTHGGVLDIIWRHASGVPLNGARDAALLNVSINRVGVQGRKWEVLDWGDVGHVADEVGDDVVP
jgi:probable phosphoglycerate mutase